MFKLDLEKIDKSEIKLLMDHRKSKRVPQKHLLLLYWLCQSLRLCVSQQTSENSSRDGNTRTPYLFPEKSVYRSRSNKTRHGAINWFQIGNRVVKAVYHHPTYLIYVQSTSCEMLGWMKYKLELRYLGEIWIPRYANDTTLIAEIEE